MPYESRHSVDFSVTPERLFDALTDVERRRAWVPMLIGVQREDAGPPVAGSTWSETFKTLGVEDSVDSTVRLQAVQVERPRRYVVQQLSPPGAKQAASMRWDYTLVPQGSGTRLAVQMNINYGGSGVLGLLARLLAKGTGPFAARQLRDELQALQALMDVLR